MNVESFFIPGALFVLTLVATSPLWLRRLLRQHSQTGAVEQTGRSVRSAQLKLQMGVVKRTNDPEAIIKQYIQAGLEFGSAVSDLAIGQCIGFEDLHALWEVREKKYAQLGYVTVSIDAFEQCAGWGHNIDHLFKQKRPEGEQPVLHAEIYRKYFLNRMSPALDLNKMMKDGQPQFGTYFVPSTEAIAEALRNEAIRQESENGD
jgi:hypothetical protein